MQSGKIFDYDVYEAKVSIDPTVPALGGGSGKISTLWDTPSVPKTGYFLFISSGKDSTGDSTIVNFSSDIFGTHSVSYTTFMAVTNTSFEMDNLRLYANPSLPSTGTPGWGMAWSAARWKVGGTVIISWGAGFIEGQFFAPSGIPVIGHPPILEGGASWAYATADDRGNGSWSASCKTKGGWRVKLAGETGWTTFPVSVNVQGGHGCVSATDTFSGEVDSASSYTISTSAPAADYCWDGPVPHVLPNGGEGDILFPYEYVKISSHTSYSSGNVMLLPCVARQVNKIGADYAAMIYRGAFSDLVHNLQKPGVDGYEPDTTVTEFSGANSPFLSIVTNAPHLIENVLRYTPTAPYQNQWSDISIVDARAATNRHVGNAQPGSVGQWASNTRCNLAAEGGGTIHVKYSPPQPPAQGGLASFPNIEVGDYLNFHVCPFWSYSYFFPIEDDDDRVNDRTVFWKVGGSVANPSDYWHPVGQQWLHHPDLPDYPVNERHETRTDLMLSPVSLTPYPAAWWGVSRFLTQSPTLASSVTADTTTGAAWSVTGGTLAFAPSGVTVTPTTATVFVSYDLGQFTSKPYLYAHLCDRIGVSWTGSGSSGITEAKCWIEGAYGDKLAEITAPGTLTFTGHSDGKYAGSWARGFDPRDGEEAGMDIGTSGDSATVSTGAERGFAFGMLGGFTGAKIKFSFTVPSPSQVVIAPPVFTAATGKGVVIPESSLNVALLRPNASGVRWGQLTFDNGTNFKSTPSSRTFGERSSLLDWLAWKNCVLNGIAPGGTTDPLTQINAQISALYDAQELGLTGTDTPDMAVIGATQATQAILAPGGTVGVGIVSNVYREVPPVPNVAPTRRLDANLQPMTPTTWCGDVTAWDNEARFYITRGKPASLQSPANPRVTWTSVVNLSLAGWRVSSHTHPGQ